MEAFFQIAFSFPTVVYTVFLLVSVVYWVMMIAGLVDLDAFDLDLDLDMDGDVDLELDFGADADMDADFDADVGEVDAGEMGAGEMDADADFDADAGEMDGDVDADGSASGEGLGLVGSILSFLGLGTVPMMIIVTVFSLFAWVATFMAVSFFFGTAGAGPLFGSAIMAAAFVAAIPVTGTAMTPLKGLFETSTKTAGHTIVGSVVKITTSRVDETFGRADYNDGGAGLVLSVRYDGSHELTRGDKALIIDHDNENDVYHVEPYDVLMSDDDDSSTPANAGRDEEVTLEETADEKIEQKAMADG